MTSDEHNFIQSAVDDLIKSAQAGQGSALMNEGISDYEVNRTFGRGSDTPGPDGISARLIDKADRGLMHNCLLLLWNKAWANGYFMSEWKREHRVIIPKPDKDNYNECSSYRTISLTSCLGKRYESITAQRLASILDSMKFDVS